MLVVVPEEVGDMVGLVVVWRGKVVVVRLRAEWIGAAIAALVGFVLGMPPGT
jgi:hypothetical protein